MDGVSAPGRSWLSGCCQRGGEPHIYFSHTSTASWHSSSGTATWQILDVFYSSSSPRGVRVILLGLSSLLLESNLFFLNYFFFPVLLVGITAGSVEPLPHVKEYQTVIPQRLKDSSLIHDAATAAHQVRHKLQLRLKKIDLYIIITWAEVGSSLRVSGQTFPDVLQYSVTFAEQNYTLHLEKNKWETPTMAAASPLVCQSHFDLFDPFSGILLGRVLLWHTSLIRAPQSQRLQIFG